MKKITFTKMVASGNDFVVLRAAGRRYPLLARKICDRKYGIGADGLLVLEKSRKADVRMRIFNSDGSEAEMCGNGARCAAFYLYYTLNNAIPASPTASPRGGVVVQQPSLRAPKGRSNLVFEIASVASLPRNDNCRTASGPAGGRYPLRIETKAGIIDAGVNRENVKIKLTDPKDIKLNIPIKVNNRTLRVNFINTGVPHTVVFVEGLDKINVMDLGRQIRYHKKFRPQGTNVNFVEALSNDTIKVRTYERGVEDETLACGTGSVASALITNYQLPITGYGKINVHTKGREILKVYFNRVGDRFNNIWLEGKVQVVYKGEITI